MILDWKLCLLSTLEVISKKGPEVKNMLHFITRQVYIGTELFSKYLVFLSGTSFQHPSWWGSCASVLVCFGFFLTASKLVNTVLGNKKWECLTPLCRMWQQELVSASGEVDSSSDRAFVARSLSDKWGFVWLLQYTHCSVLGGEMQYFRCLNTLQLWLQRPLPALQCDSASGYTAQN